MALIRSSALRWGIIFLCLLLGTWLGIFLQRFGATSAIFTNFINFNINVKQVDLIMLRLGFNFAMKINLGTVIGGALGVWAAR